MASAVACPGQERSTTLVDTRTREPTVSISSPRDGDTRSPRYVIRVDGWTTNTIPHSSAKFSFTWIVGGPPMEVSRSRATIVPSMPPGSGSVP